MNKTIYSFLKDDYKIVKIMCENEVVLMGKKIVPLSQNNLVEISGYSKAKVNSIINWLIKCGYISFVSNGKYKINNEARKLYAYFENGYK